MINELNPDKRIKDNYLNNMKYIVHSKRYKPGEYIGTYKRGRKTKVKVRWTNLEYRGIFSEHEIPLHEVLNIIRVKGKFEKRIESLIENIKLRFRNIFNLTE